MTPDGALRAVPMLQQLRFASRDMVAGQFAEILKTRYPGAPEARVRLAMRMMVELTYSATEMAVEEPDQDALALSREVCSLPLYPTLSDEDVALVAAEIGAWRR